MNFNQYLPKHPEIFSKWNRNTLDKIPEVATIMDDPILSREFGWTESSESDVSDDPFANEVDFDFQSSEEDKVPFARHGPLLEADIEELCMQREF